MSKTNYLAITITLIVVINIPTSLSFIFDNDAFRSPVIPKFQPQGLTYHMECNGVFAPARFLRYGCWCGPFNPSGGYNARIHTVDALDACCKAHDKCIADARNNHGHGDDLFADTAALYYVSCTNRKSKCHARGSFGLVRVSAFAQEVCNCDRVFGICMGRHHGSYRISNILPGSGRCNP